MQKLRILGLSLLLLAGLSVQDKANAQPGVSISFQTFYNELAPYGRWINSPQYGSVWTPDVTAGFQPYSTNGYWEVTEYGNTWVSDYNWGWAPFHYGRWSYDDYNGWFWIPGYEWGPAWVNWRTGGDYYGWAPLGPGMNVNISINIPSFWWVFVPQRYIASRSWYNYCAPRNYFSNIYGQTTIINNYYRNGNRTYAYGPRRDEMERVTNRSIPVRQIDMNQRGRVISDRSYGGNNRYDAPNHNAPVYESNRGPVDARTLPNGRDNAGGYNNRSNSGGYNGRDDSPATQNRDRSYPSNGRVNSPSDNSGYQSPGRGRTSSPDVSQGNNNRSYEPARPSNASNIEQRQQSAPSYNSDRGSRQDRPSDAGSYNSGGRSGGNAPEVRSAPAQRSSAPRESQRTESRSDNSGGNSRSERSGRSPR